MATQPQAGRPVRPLVAVALAAAAFLAGMAARGALGAGDEAGEEAASIVAAEEPTGNGEKVVRGFARTSEGARAAALTYTTVLAQHLLYLEPEDAATAIRAVAARASADTLSTEAVNELRGVREPLAAGDGPTWWVVQPLAVRVDAVDGDRARVSVWLVRMLSRQGVVVPQSSWVTESVDLVWERGDWRLWATSSTPGPTPVIDGSDMPASAAALNDELAGYELVDRRFREP